MWGGCRRRLQEEQADWELTFRRVMKNWLRRMGRVGETLVDKRNRSEAPSNPPYEVR